MGTYSGVYHPEKLIISKKDAAHSYARGHCAVGTEILDVALNRVCKLTGGCGGPGLEGFLVYQPAGSETPAPAFRLISSSASRWTAAASPSPT